MSEPPRFPKDPLKGTEGRILDEFGQNRFADQESAEALPDTQESDNLYSTSVSEEAVYEPDYEPAIYHRGGPILALSIAGLATAVGFSIILVWQSIAVFLCACSFALSISAVVMARGDLRAIRAGAMDATGSGGVVSGLITGIIGALISGGAVALSIYLRRGLF